MLPGLQCDRQRGKPRLPHRHARIQPRSGGRAGTASTPSNATCSGNQRDHREHPVTRRRARRQRAETGRAHQVAHLQARRPRKRGLRPARRGAVRPRSPARKRHTATSTWSTSPPTLRAPSRPSPTCSPASPRSTRPSRRQLSSTVRRRQCAARQATKTQRQLGGYVSYTRGGPCGRRPGTVCQRSRRCTRTSRQLAAKVATA